MKRWKISGDPTAAIVSELARILEAQGIALLPTDTIYGLHGLAGDSAVAERIAQWKGRPDDKPFVILAANAKQLGDLQVTVPAVLATIWPAPLTAILPTADHRSLAVRIPDRRWLRDLLESTGPLVSTSANRSGEPPITSPAELVGERCEMLEAIVDAGVREARASALVDLTGVEPRWIREGDPRFTQKLRKTLRKTL